MDANNILVEDGGGFYRELREEVDSMISTEPDLIAGYANVSSLLFHAMNERKCGSINWLGFYRIMDGTCVVGPFQGKIACIRIPFGKGVVGTAAEKKETQMIADVNAVKGHIACDSESKSEIVVPVFNEKNEMISLLDIDSTVTDCFTDLDKAGLEHVMKAFARPEPKTTPSKNEIKHAKGH